MRPQQLEAVIISVNFADMLSLTLPKNKRHFDNIVVITDENDRETVNVCRDENVNCYSTDAFYYKGAKLNKGLAINVGFKHLKYRSWIGNLDADIILDENFREKFDSFATDIECSYSSRRYDVPTYQEWLEIERNQELLKTKKLYRGIGYGNNFFFHYRSEVFQTLIDATKGLPYPCAFNNVATSDWIFRNFWSNWIYDPPLNDDPNQHAIEHNDHAERPDDLKELPFYAIHLGETGKNESGRATPKFGETPQFRPKSRVIPEIAPEFEITTIKI